MEQWTKQAEIALISSKQEYYISKLVGMLTSTGDNAIKTINFNSSTGTGKTNMMALLFNKLPHIYFVVTTLSRGHLHKQINANLSRLAHQSNYVVYGLQDYTASTRRTAEDILSLLPRDREIIWVRDEGHIHTNKWQEIIAPLCKHIVNFSATNKDKNGIVCNFTETAMLRTVSQKNGTPMDAIQRLIQVKQEHASISDYNPCLLFRVLDDKITNDIIIPLCIEYKLRYINITVDDFDMSELCRDDNEYDVIINKFKIIEGIDIRRAHVLYMDNNPSNISTTIQIIGRCRRNALLWRDDIDIFATHNAELLKYTRQCYVYYNISDTYVDQREGELLYELCDRISVQDLTVGATIYVQDGYLPNGLAVLELEGMTGYYQITTDATPATAQEIESLHDFAIDTSRPTGFNIVDNPEFYRTKLEYIGNNYISYIRNGLPTKIPLHDIIASWHVAPLSLANKPTLPKEEFACLSTTPTAYNKLIEDYSKRLTQSDSSLNSHQYTDPLCYVQYINKGDNYVSTGVALDKDYIDNLYLYSPYNKISSTRESATIAPEKFRFIRDYGWVEERTLSSKLSTHSKLNSFVVARYKSALHTASLQLFNTKTSLHLDQKQSACIGFCVEYYAKYLLLGTRFIAPFIAIAQKEYGIYTLSNIVIIRACILAYRDNMIRAFGKGVSKLTPSISISRLVEDDYKAFNDTIIELGTRTYIFLKNLLGDMTSPLQRLRSPILTIDHLSALCDIATADTIIDIKCTGAITQSNIKQLLGYHYLSQYRDDLNIKTLIIYDAITDRHITLKPLA